MRIKASKICNYSLINLEVFEDMGGKSVDFIEEHKKKLLESIEEAVKLSKSIKVSNVEVFENPFHSLVYCRRKSFDRCNNLDIDECIANHPDDVAYDVAYLISVTVYTVPKKYKKYASLIRRHPTFEYEV